MSVCLYSTGQFLNALARAASVPVFSPAADVLYPPTQAWDNRPARPARFGSLATDPKVTAAALNILTNPEFATDLSDWTQDNTGTATTVQNAGPPTHAVLTAGTGVATLRRDIPLRAGEKLRVALDLQGDGTNACKARLYDPLTNKYLKSDGTWGLVGVVHDMMSVTTGGSFTTTQIAAALDSIVLHGGGFLPKLRLSIFQSAGVGKVKSTYVWPTINAVAVFGHNIPPGLTVELRGDNGGFSGAGTLIATLTVRQPAFYATFADQTFKGYRFMVVATPPLEQFYMGELWLGYLNSSSLWDIGHPDSDVGGPRQSFGMPQLRDVSEQGEQSAFNMSSQERLGEMQLPIRMIGNGAFDDVVGELFARSEWGAQPMVLVPDSTHPYVYFGKPGGGLSIDYVLRAMRDGTLIFSGEPMPRIAA